jgi:hypothetical protein
VEALAGFPVPAEASTPCFAHFLTPFPSLGKTDTINLLEIQAFLTTQQ